MCNRGKIFRNFFQIIATSNVREDSTLKAPKAFHSTSRQRQKLQSKSVTKCDVREKIGIRLMEVKFKHDLFTADKSTLNRTITLVLNLIQ